MTSKAKQYREDGTEIEIEAPPVPAELAEYVKAHGYINEEKIRLEENPDLGIHARFSVMFAEAQGGETSDDRSDKLNAAIEYNRELDRLFDEAIAVENEALKVEVTEAQQLTWHQMKDLYEHGLAKIIGYDDDGEFAWPIYAMNDDAADAVGNRPDGIDDWTEEQLAADLGL